MARKVDHKKYYWANREKKLAQHKEWKKANAEHSAAYMKEYSKAYRANLPREKKLWLGAKERAKSAGLEFTITVDDIKIPDTCPALGIPIIPGDGKAHHNSPSVDRIDSSRGYVPDNIVIVSWRANSIKKDATPEELMAIAKFYGKEQDG